MKYLKYPDEVTLNGYLAKKEPMLIAISFDGETALISRLDDSFEHHILLAHFGIKQTDIDKYFRIAVDEDTADWTFVCPGKRWGAFAGIPINTIFLIHCINFKSVTKV